MLVRFDFTYSRLSNFFFFVSNLSKWHFSTRPKANQFWLEKTGQLTKEEKQILVQLKKFFLKHPFGKSYWGHSLLTLRENIWPKKFIFNPKEIRLLEQAHHNFMPRFDRLWVEEEPLLKQWQEKLISTQKQYGPPQLLSDLSIFFDHQPISPHLDIWLLMGAPSNSASGGANLDEAITLEVSRTSLEYIRPVWLTFWHEVVHMLLEKKSKHFHRLLDKFPKKNQNLFKEAVIEALLPHGYAAEKYFNFPSDDYYKKTLPHLSKLPPLTAWRIYSGNKLRQLVKQYLIRSQKIDTTFLTAARSAYLEFRQLELYS